MGYFKLVSKVKLDDLNIGDILKESDFSSLTPNGNFIQMTYVPEEGKRPSYPVSAGVYTISSTSGGMELFPTRFTRDKILEEFIFTKTVTEFIDKFFEKLHVYYEEGIEVPKRAALLYGPAGTGKTTVISNIAEKYEQAKDTLIVVWRTDTVDASDVKDFIKSFEYNGVNKMILIAEDIGGIENDEARIRSDSSLLALLDNKEKTFSLPVYIIATTNFPENLMGNLTNRPDRFDDKIKVDFPSAESRVSLLKFYLKDSATDSALALIASKKCDEFTPAHIREIRLRSKIHDKTPETVIAEIQKEIDQYKKAFTKQATTGFGLYE